MKTDNRLSSRSQFVQYSTEVITFTKLNGVLMQETSFRRNRRNEQSLWIHSIDHNKQKNSRACAMRIFQTDLLFRYSKLRLKVITMIIITIKCCPLCFLQCPNLHFLKCNTLPDKEVNNKFRNKQSFNFTNECLEDRV